MDKQRAMLRPPRPTDQAERVVGQRAGPGVLVLSPTMQLVHMNQQAWELVGRIGRQENSNLANGMLPAALVQVCAEIQSIFQKRTDNEDMEQLEVKRLAGNQDRPVLLRAFGLPDYNGNPQALILILLEEVGRQNRALTRQARERYRLTPREQGVLEHLLRGLTNKEIAGLLGISEATVKEHIKQIKRKTHSTTRTGILAHLFAS
jgi:DNA-binding CsgD family transcriptional regulator